MRLLLSLAYIATLPLVLCATFRSEPVTGTRVTLSPQLGIAPLAVQVRASIADPSPDWYCPEMRIAWSDGTESVRESDCEPWEGLSLKRYYSETVWKRLGPGRHDITVTLKQGAKVREFAVFAEVSGE